MKMQRWTVDLIAAGGHTGIGWRPIHEAPPTWHTAGTSAELNAPVDG